MDFKAAAASAVLLVASAAGAQDYQSFSALGYTDIDAGALQQDGVTLESSYYFERISPLGPLNEFSYILPVSSVSLAYADFDDDTWVISGEYYWDQFVVGAAANDADGLNRASFGYFFSSDFLGRVEVVDDDVETEFFLSGRYQYFLQGGDYIGFNARIDDEFDELTVSAKYFRALGGARFLALGGNIDDTGDDNILSVTGAYYWDRRTSASAGLRDNGGFSAGFKHFFNQNFSFSLDYDDLGDGVRIANLRVGAQF